MLTAIWAQDKNGLIGQNGTLPWHLPNDLKFFKAKTVGHTIVMGRTTFVGMGSRPLPNRTSLVMTRDKAYQAPEGVIVMHSMAEVLAYAKDHEDTLITGGAKVFAEFLPHLDKIYRTVINGEFEGDTYFPAVDWSQWELVASEPGIIDEKNKYPHVFETYLRKK